jgi:acetylornithine deacetylase/succinyl-diaminopimelate desuccinylase-like protein
VLEPSRQGALVVSRKGVGRFELEVQGVASHSGSAHERGISAVEELAHQVLQLEAMTDYRRGTTVSVGVVQGGSKVNVRPASARASIDLRVTTAEEGQRGPVRAIVLDAWPDPVRAAVLAENLPTPMIKVGVEDEFSQSGKITPQKDDLKIHFGLRAEDVAVSVKEVIAKKESLNKKRNR